eukprot:3686430-Prymnesium_polylepis.2
MEQSGSWRDVLAAPTARGAHTRWTDAHGAQHSAPASSPVSAAATLVSRLWLQFAAGACGRSLIARNPGIPTDGPRIAVCAFDERLPHESLESNRNFSAVSYAWSDSPSAPAPQAFSVPVLAEARS